MRLVIIGGGNMGGAILIALTKIKKILPKNILLIENNEEKRINLTKKTGCLSQKEIDQSISDYGLLLIAVKPQGANSIFEVLEKFVLPEQLIISVMAGISLKTLSSKLRHKKLVRAMPNIPAMIAEGMTVFFASEKVKKKECKWIKLIFSSCGHCIEVESEDAIDAATAISGSGPGYIYFFAEQMTSSAKLLGFSEKDSIKLVQKTLLGSILLWEKQSFSIESLKQKVCSPNGTTLAAINHFESKKINNSIKKGIEKAYLRAKELSS